MIIRKTKCICVIILLLISSCGKEERVEVNKTVIKQCDTLNSEDAVDSTFKVKLSSEFKDVFIKHKEFVIDTSVKIGMIQSLDANQNGDIIITDFQVAQAIVINSNGKLKVKLTPEPCNPGFHWSPVKAVFIDNYIYIINASPWGYKFDLNGNCIGEMSKSFLPPYILSGLDKNHLIGYYALEGNQSLKVLDTEGNEKSSFGIFPEEYKNFIFRVEGGGLVVDKYKNIYQMNITSPTIYKYNKTGKLLNTFKNYPDRFVKLKKDLSPDAMTMIKETGEAFKYVSLALGLFMLNDSTLLMKVKDGRGKYKLLLLNLEFELLHDEAFVIKEDLILAKNGYLYFVKDEVMNHGDYINPKIVIYKMKLRIPEINIAYFLQLFLYRGLL